MPISMAFTGPFEGVSLRKAIFLVMAGLLAMGAQSASAADFQLAQDLTCEQATAYYQKNHVIYVLSHDVIALPIRVGVPVSEAATLQCTEQGQRPHGYSVATRDRRRCVIAVTC
ncbi:MAG: hypothetical protein ACTHLC_19635 [Rhizobiaceae bacterium]